MTKTLDDRPIIALAMGDPAGISAELTAKLVASDDVRQAAHLIVIGDRRVFDEGARIADLNPDIEQAALGTIPSTRSPKPIFIDLANLDPADIIVGEANLVGGQYATENFAFALRLANEGRADAVCFTPFNKKAMRFAYSGYDDEIRFISEIIGFTGKAREFNVLENIWNARVTSHIPLAAVSSHLSQDAILAELELTFECLKRAGIASPKIAVAGLNPHAGDGGSFGSEEIEIISPAVDEAIRRGWDVSGPYPADTVFLSALKAGMHAVLTMYHDQGQIAMKMMGFDRGVTMLGGLPFPVCTPAHGTAYDIAGKGVANPRASREALLLAARMSRHGKTSISAH
ncbi:4-hydroxythreonine-4-phosphate dehydrogenase PdxA [Phyllobacterium sp. 628]|uniref:4-hydroxythreonine-4-phosphate dehydrogenase PdxA n=1 Tax=Phyllobacterium sp. 628 TaxID=2718938 RepID=UPI0016622953|nr:4-hydroxythreonine-4-phosphate dehydrogenase PdxA [Phyllobacterium sp. 628]QND50778.1 4-hydroxythreonine-4-phosphate dehydrogenase PdxA [Phyllobacterium sp. 628]